MKIETVVSESRARRAARRVGLVTKKSRWRKHSIDNRGEFMLLDANRNAVVAGEKFDLSAEDILAFCAEQ